MTAPITSAARRNVNGFSVTHAAILDYGNAVTPETDLYGVRSASLTPDVGTLDITGDDVVLDTFDWMNHAALNVTGGYISFDAYSKIYGVPVTVGGTATAATVLFTPNASGGTGAGDTFDYSGPAAISFDVDGNTVTLNSDLTDLAGVVAAVDAALPATYTVSAVGGQVSIALAAAGTGTITIGGANAVAVTGSPSYSNTAGANSSELSVPLWQEDAGNQPPRPMLIRMASHDALGGLLALDIVLFRVKFGIMTFNGPTFKTGLEVSYPSRVLFSQFDETGAALPKKACGRLISKIAV